ncbi:hypothetical protein [Actinomadura sp. SCN-SB]|uniref:hypothetical protein n=1 Tax=Actinomadura sp. SCN-SB TaxID=3373092 RepID=UPI0037519B16
MTERSQGAPDPDKSVIERPLPSGSGAVIPITGRAAPEPPPEPVPLTGDTYAVRRTDALIDALGGRRPAGDDPGLGLAHDPAVNLLKALLKDVSEPSVAASPDQGADGPDRAGPPRGPRRRGSRTIVALGVAGAVLATTGVAAAGPGEAPPQQDAAGPVEDISKPSTPPATAPTETGTTVLAGPPAPVRRPPEPERDRPSEDTKSRERKDGRRGGPLARGPFRRDGFPYHSTRADRTGRSDASFPDGRPSRIGEPLTRKGWRVRLDVPDPWRDR